MIKTEGKIEKNVVWILLIIIVLQLFVVMKFGFDKESYHLDVTGVQWHGFSYVLFIKNSSQRYN
jgi:hypothetical protein